MTSDEARAPRTQHTNDRNSNQPAPNPPQPPAPGTPTTATKPSRRRSGHNDSRPQRGLPRWASARTPSTPGVNAGPGRRSGSALTPHRLVLGIAPSGRQPPAGLRPLAKTVDLQLGEYSPDRPLGDACVHSDLLHGLRCP